MVSSFLLRVTVLIFPQGQCFVALNPKMFADGFEDRMQCLMDQYRNLEPVRTHSKLTD